MSFPPHPTPTARDVLDVPWREALQFRAVLAFADLTGIWRAGMTTTGDLAGMTRRDILYWLYKAKHPVRCAEPGSGLEAYFAAARERRCEIPDGFEIEHELTLSAVGDLMNHEYLGRSRDSLYRHVEALVLGADVAMANLECVVTDAPRSPFVITASSGPRLSLSADELDAVTGGGARRRYDFLATACNHSLDFDEDGVASTIAALRARGIAFHGVSEHEADARRACILERRGVRLGIVSFTFGTNARKPPPERPNIVNVAQLNGSVEQLDLDLLGTQLAHCRAERVDFVIAQLHWGLEHELYPRPAQLEVAHHLAELGVDAIFGHHPHVIQPMELYRTRRDPDRLVPIYYSLGNLTTPFSEAWTCRSQVAKVRLSAGRTKDGARRTYVAEASADEVVQTADTGTRTLALVPG